MKKKQKENIKKIPEKVLIIEFRLNPLILMFFIRGDKGTLGWAYNKQQAFQTLIQHKIEKANLEIYHSPNFFFLESVYWQEMQSISKEDEKYLKRLKNFLLQAD